MPADIQLDQHGLVQPDVFVRGLVGGRPARGWNTGAPLLLAIDVLSPSTARADRTTKRGRYQRAGVPEYWIVDLDARRTSVINDLPKVAHLRQRFPSLYQETAARP